MIMDPYEAMDRITGRATGRNKGVINIMRGIPGSGKSRYVRVNREYGDLSCSADDYFQRGGVYHFDSSKLKEAHAHCMWLFLRSVEREQSERVRNGGQCGIWVDNTGIHAWELSPYVAIANAYGTPYQIIEMGCELAVALDRQKHDVPGAIVAQMHHGIQWQPLPSWWTVKKVWNGEGV